MDDFKRLKTLIVEDDAKIIALYKKALHSTVFQLKILRSGTKAITELTHYHHDLVLLDIKMPSVSGISVLRHLRLDLANNYTPVIMITSSSDSTEVKSCLKYNISGYIVKPFDYKKLAFKILDYYQVTEKDHSLLLKEALIQIDNLSVDKDIVNIISKHTKLKKRDYFYFGPCPFPNCSGEIKVSEEKQIFSCEVCERKGDVFTFVMELTGLIGRELMECFKK